MSVYSQYADRMAERYSVIKRIDQTPVSWEDGYVPLAARRGPDHARRALDRFHDTLIGERKRVREEQIKQLLGAQPTWDLLNRVPLGKATSIRKLVEQQPRVLLLGETGAGKTTALQSLVVEQPVLPSSEHVLVVLINLPDVPDLGNVSLPEYLSADAEQRLSISASPEFFEKALVGGRAVIGLDGLDEMSGPQERALAVKQVESWVSEFPNCHYVVTARYSGYDTTLSRDTFVHYGLIPWSESVVQEIARSWDQALASWEASEPDRPYSAERSRFWRHLVWAMRSHNARSVSTDQAEEWLTEAARADKALRLGRRRVSGEVQALLEQSVSELPFVQVVDGHLSFVSALIQDVVSARALESLCVDSGVQAAWTEIEGHLGAAAWRETIVLALRFLAKSHPDLCEDLLDRLLSTDGDSSWEPVLRRRLLLAVSVLQGTPGGHETSTGLGQAVRQRIVDRLVAWITDAEAVGREDAVYAWLGLDGEPYATDRATEIAQDESLDVWSREAALLVLGRLGGARVSETTGLLASYLGDAEIEARLQLAAATALGALGGSSALSGAERGAMVEQLLNCIRNPDAGIDLRVAVSEALSAIHSVAPEAAISEVLVALVRAENAEDRPPYSVQTAAGRALGQVLMDGAGPEFTEQMLALARDVEVNAEVRTALAETLGTLGEAEAAAQVLIAIVQDAKLYPPAHKAALEALGRVGYADQAILDRVVQIAQTKDRKVKDFERVAASQALGGLGHPDLAIQNMLMLIADKSLYRSTRNDALGYLGRLGSTGEADLDAAVVAVLQIWVNEENTTEDVRENAIESLRMLRVSQGEVIRDLVAVIQNKGTYPRVRRVAAAQLGRFPVEQKDLVVDALSPVFYDPDEKSDLLRVPIARMLFLWGEDEQALAYLRLAAEQSYMAQVRYDASMVLLEIGELGVGTAELLRLAQNPEISDVIRCDAVRALGLWMTGNEDTALALAGIAQNTELEPNVRGAAYASLRAITS
jgi:hypothetical protein